MPEHVVPVDRELSEELEEYFALTTATELPSGVRHLDSWSLSEAHRRRWAWRTGGGTLAAVVVVAAVLVLTLHRGGSAGQTPLADSAASKGVASSVARSGNGSSASGLLGIAPGSAGFSQQALPADGAGDTTTQGKSPDAPLSLPAGAAAGSGAAPHAPVTATSSQAPSIVIGSPTSGHLERSVTASYTVAPNTFLTSFEDVSSRAVALGGYVASSNTQPDKTGRIVAGTVSLKVPSAKLTDFLNGMGPAFVASSIDFASVDHTAQFVDVTSRLTSARARLDAINALLPRATSLGDIATLEHEVETVQVEIDTYQGQLNGLNDSVDMATATITLSERGATVASPPPPPPVSSGLATGWDNAVHVTGAIAEGLITALPVLVLVLLVGFGGWMLWSRAAASRRRTRHAG